jgi:hypothetical protein
LNGEIKIYERTGATFALSFTLSAHLRTINSLTSYKNYFITAGDDCYVNIWKLSGDDVKLVESIEAADKMPVGVEYDVNNKLLLIAFFDSLSLSSYAIDLK